MPGGPLSSRIMREPLPPGMEKPPIIDMYDRSTDPDDHIEKIKVVLDYISVRGSIKYKFFPTTLRKGAMAWYKSLPAGSIDTWGELCGQFTAYFTASRRHLKT
jgi:hypothetical protein